MVTMAQRITELRDEKGLSRPALSAALGLPKLAVEKFETGRQTPTQAQQQQLASFFGVSVSYLRGESRDRTRMEDWLGAVPAEEEAPAPAVRPARPTGKTQTGPAEQGGVGVMGSFLNSPQFQKALRNAVLDVLHSPEGETVLLNLIRKEMESRRE